MLKLAWRNIWRKRGRSFLTALAMALVVMFTMFQSGLMGAIKNALFTSLVNTGGHVQIHPQNYRDARDFGDTLIRNAEQVNESLNSVLPANTDLVSVLQTGGLLEGNNGRSRGIALIGILQPATLRETFVEDYVSEGKLPEDNDVESIALGMKLAKSLKVNLGDTVYMYTSNTEGYGAAAYTVVGLLDIAGSQAVAYTSLQAAQELAAPDAVSRIEVHLNNFVTIADNAKLPAVKTQIEKALDGSYSIETWDEVSPDLKGYLDTIGPVSLVFLGIFFVLAGLVVMNTIYLSVIERVREFGVMMALGLSRWKVMLMVAYESLFLCGTGAVLGAILGSLILWYTSRGITIPAFQTLFDGFPDTLYTTISTERIIIIVVFVFVTGILAALWPARTAGRLEPVEAMRFTA
jgi:ABC-type lipoprotein release transport system permease subunit